MKIEKKRLVQAGQIVMVAIIIICAIFSMKPLKDEKGAKVALDQGKLNYTGDLVRRKFNGKGTLKFADGSVYTGTFKDGYFNGQGDFQAKDGWHYVGGFKKGKAQGKGVLTLETGAIYKGQFEDGVYQEK